MPGKHITQLQRNRYMKHRQTGLTQSTSAVKSGFSDRTARRVENEPCPLPTKRHWRTRPDPFADIWETECLPLLINEPTLTGLTLWEHLESTYPDQYPESTLRTLQRRVKQWRLKEGPDQEVMFHQSIPAGLQGFSDFTHPNCQITIKGEPFTHLIYQFRLAYSGWRYAHIVRGGESFSALSEGLQKALHQLGGAPLEHRTDSLSAAYVNASEQKQLTENYHTLCEHYRMKPTRNNLGVSHENGTVETAHHSLKHRIDQACRLRGSYDFDSIASYRAVMEQAIKKLNKFSKTRLQQELKSLQPLPQRAFMAYQKEVVKVTCSSTILVKNVTYSVPSRLIGTIVEVHLYHDRLQGFSGNDAVFELPRLYQKAGQKRQRKINYRHLIRSLVAKPQAFRYSKIREDILPNDEYRQLWQWVDQQMEPYEACKWIVTALDIAAQSTDDTAWGQTLLQWAQEQRLPSVQQLQKRQLDAATDVITPEITQHTLAQYDSTTMSTWAQQGAQSSC